jgi:hypothetical protein
LAALARDELLIVDASPRSGFGAGRLGGYRVRSDTRARVFAECVEWLGDSTSPQTKRLIARCSTDEPISLAVAAQLLRRSGDELLQRLQDRPRVRVLDRTRLVGLSRRRDGVALTLRTRGSVEERIVDQVVLGLGGRSRFPASVVPDIATDIHSDPVLRDPGLRALVSRLDPGRPRVAVVGGSHSAFAVARRLLRADLPWAAGAIEVFHRSPVRMTYADTAAARVDGAVVRPEDVCPATGLVHRFGGLRTDAAALYRRVRSGEERRVQLIPLTGELTDHIGSARRPATVWATGYDSPVGSLLSPGNGEPGAAHWDPEGRLVVDGQVWPGVFGMGLGTGRPRSARTGGEPAFHGSVDGVWFYQRIVAPQLLELLLAS